MKNWWDSLKEKKDPHPHIPEKEILEAMPENLHKVWKVFINGQTGLSLQGDFGVYPWDFGRFLGKLKRIEELKAQEAKEAKLKGKSPATPEQDG